MKKIHKTIVIFITLLVISVFIFLSVVIILRSITKESRFVNLLEKSDNSLRSCDYFKAYALLKQGLAQAASKKQYVRILNKAFQLAEKMDDAAVFKEFALHAFEKKPGKKEIFFIAAYACLRAGDSKKALELLHKPKLSEQLRTLKVEALLLEGETENLAVYYTPSQPFRFLHLFTTDDPVYFEDAARILDDRRLFLNTSLLYANKKNIREAFRIISSYADDPLFYSPAVFITYDAGEFIKVEQLINLLLLEKAGDTAVLYSLYGDVKMHSGEYDKAVSLYKKAITIDPLVSETTYLNISYISQQQGDFQSALDWLKNGFKHYPQNRSIVLEAARFFIALEQKETAASIIHSYTENNAVYNSESNTDYNSGDFMIQLMHLYLDQENMHPSRYRISLWDLFNANPGNEILCRFLVLYLFGLGDINGAQSALTLFDMQRGIGEVKKEYLFWVPHYKGLCEIITGSTLNNRIGPQRMLSRYQKALDYFTSSLIIEENPVVLFHRALLFIELHRLKAAEDDLWRITKAEVTVNRENQSFLSLVNSTLGTVYIRSGEYSKAWDCLMLAREMDPENYKVLTVMKELEELQQ